MVAYLARFDEFDDVVDVVEHGQVGGFDREGRRLIHPVLQFDDSEKRRHLVAAHRPVRF